MNPLAWLNPGRWLLYLGLVATLVLGYHAWRDHQQDVGYQRAVDDFARQAKATDAKREVVTQYVDREVVKTVKAIRVVTETITKEVPIYVPSDSCPLPPGFRVLHDAAARGQVPNPAAVPDAAAAPAQDVAATVTANYGACLDAAARLTGLQQWVRRQQELRP